MDGIDTASRPAGGWPAEMPQFNVPCECGRGPVIGTLTWTGTRMNFRAFHGGPSVFHDENAADGACVDCVADTAVAVASGEVREHMRAIGMRQRAAMLARSGVAFTCPCCGATSPHPDDIRERYCGRCHWWTAG